MGAAGGPRATEPKPSRPVVPYKPAVHLGIAVKVHIEDLVDAIRVDSDAPPCVVEAIRDMTAALRLDGNLVQQTSLASDDPLSL